MAKFLALQVVCFIGALALTANAVPLTGRVVGGEDANVGQFPHQISLQREDGSHACGGSIISPTVIVTAAHCVVVGAGIEPYPVRYYRVRVGSIQRNAGGLLLHLKKIIVHKGYGNFINDVALLILEQELTFNEYIQPIELADAEVPSGGDVIVSGWGRLYQGGPIPQRLQWNTLKALNTQQCDEAIGWGEDSLICLAHDANQGVCNGDSGGPATYNGKLVGIAGFVVGGCGTKNPDGYAKIFYHRQWILDHMP